MKGPYKNSCMYWYIKLSLQNLRRHLYQGNRTILKITNIDLIYLIKTTQKIYILNVGQ